MIELHNLRKEYNGINAVDGINLKVKEGEFFSFLGPNGAGKTTMIRMLCGLLKPTSGYAIVANYNILNESEKIKKEIGVVFETQNLYERLSVFDNLNIFGRIHKVKKERIKEILKQIELEDRKNEKVKNLSKGMKQRIMIGRAILHNPKILFLDEPTIRKENIQFDSILHQKTTLEDVFLKYTGERLN